MDIRTITPTYSVAPQLEPSDFEAVAAAGFAAVICNRPDSEVPPSHQADAMGAAARDAGLAFHVLPLTHQTFTPENIGRQADLIGGAGGPVLAYCASGTRSTIAWALGQAGRMEAGEILGAARAGGYELGHLQPMIEAFAARQD